MTVRFDISPEALQARARHAVADLRDRATEHVVNRIARQPAPVFQQARALTPEAEFKAKEAITMDDELAFLNPAPPPRPADAPLDDAALFPTGTGSAVEGGEAQVRH